MKTTVNIRFLVLIFFVCLTSNFSLHAQTNDSAYLIGKYKLKKIVDGDTFNFENLSKSTRLVCLDTEEIYKGKKAEENTLKISEKWPDFYYEKKGDSKMPVKSNSPFGYAAYLWANKFMSGVDSVILEIDDNERTTDLYDRTLVYVIIEKNNERINYNLECVRNGYSPYFSKYGDSKRFHNDFVEAQ